MKTIVFSSVPFLLLFLFSITSCKKNNDSNGNPPNPVSGQWQQTNGPCNGLIMGVAISGNTVYASWDGMYISDNKGKDWTKADNGISTYTSARAILIHHDTVLAAGGGLYRTTDNGKSWVQLCPDYSFYDLRGMSWSGKRILLCNEYWGELIISDDNGQTWKKCPEHVPDFYVSSATILDQDIFVSSQSNGIYKSTDNGQTYSLSNNGLTDTRVLSLGTNGSTLYAGTANGLYFSADHGGDWTLISIDPLFLNFPVEHLAFNGSAILAGGYMGLIFSQDNGITWSRAVNGLPDQRIQSVAAEGSTFLAGTGSGVYLSEISGQSWKAIGLPVTYVHSFAVDGTDLFCCAVNVSGGVCVTPDGGRQWNFLYGGLPVNEVQDISFNGNTLLAATDSGVFVSSDRGLTWTKKSNGIPAMDDYNTVTCVAGHGNNLYAGTYSSGIFYSHDGGENWSHSTVPFDEIYYAVCFYICDKGVYAGTFSRGILFSSDHGQTWTTIGKGLPEVTVVSSIVETGSVMFAATFSGVYSSSDNGASWNLAGNELSGKVIYGIATRGNDLFAATKDDGVFMSSSEGNSWIPVNEGFPAGALAYDVAVIGPWLFVATNGKGVWRHPL